MQWAPAVARRHCEEQPTRFSSLPSPALISLLNGAIPGARGMAG